MEAPKLKPNRWENSTVLAKRRGRFYPTQEKRYGNTNDLMQIRRNTKQDGTGEWVEDDFEIYY